MFCSLAKLFISSSVLQLTDAEPAILLIVMQFASTASKLVILGTTSSLLDTIGEYQKHYTTWEEEFFMQENDIPNTFFLSKLGPIHSMCIYRKKVVVFSDHVVIITLEDTSAVLT